MPTTYSPGDFSHPVNKAHLRQFSVSRQNGLIAHADDDYLQSYQTFCRLWEWEETSTPQPAHRIRIKLSIRAHNIKMLRLCGGKDYTVKRVAVVQRQEGYSFYGLRRKGKDSNRLRFAAYTP